MDTKALRQKILDLAIRGKLVPQDPNDEPASVLLEKIRKEKAQMVKERKLKKKDIKNDSVIYVGEDNLHYEKFADGTVKCIEDEIPFEVPKGWEWCKLSNIVQFINGDRGKNYPSKSDYLPNGIPWINTGHILDEGTLTEKEMLFISQEKYDSLHSGKIAENDLVLCLRGATFGKVARVKPYKIGAIASSLVIIRCYEYSLAEYLYYYLRSDLAIQQLHLYDNGSAQPNLAAGDVQKYLFPLPPIKEALMISERISILLALVSKISQEKRNLNAIIVNIKTKILDLAIRGQLVPQNPDDEPASALLERIRIEKEELIKQGKIKRDKKESIIFKGEDNSYYEKIGNKIKKINDEIPFEIPVKWVWCRLSEVIELFSGQDFTPDRYSDIPQGIPYITGASNLEKGHVIVNRWTSSATTHATIGDLLLTVKGSGVGKMAICDIEDAHIARQIMAIRCRNGIAQEYLRIVVSAFLTGIIDQANGIIPGIRREVVLSTLFPLPPFSEQLRISAKVRRTSGELQTIEKSLS